jgi:hypothetical protein
VKDARTIHVRAASTQLSVRYRFPNALPVEDFMKFLGDKIFQQFDFELHTLAFYYADEKFPYRFQSAQIGDCLPIGADRLRFTVFLFPEIDLTFLQEMVRVTIYFEQGILDRIVRPTMEVGELIDSTAIALGLPIENTRLIWLFDDIFDGIFRSDVPVSGEEVQNPLWIEETPEDQRSLGPDDKLLAVRYMRMRDDIRPEYEQVGKEYLRVIPDEQWAYTHKRLVKCVDGKIHVELDHRFHRDRHMLILPDTILWDLVGDMSVLKITYE